MSQQTINVGSTANDNTGDPIRTAFQKANSNFNELYAKGPFAKNGIPFIVAPTGTMANNGAITLGTALPSIYASCYLYLPANAISAGSSAGWYYAVMTSTTVGTVYNNTYTGPGVPSIPTPVAFATTGPGAYTGVTTLVSGPSVSIPANTIGANGGLRMSHLWGCPNNANNKTMACTVGGSTVFSNTVTTSNSNIVLQTMLSRGSQAAQVTGPSSIPGFGQSSSTNTYTSVNFVNAQTVQFNLQLATATDYLILESFALEVL